MLKRWARQKRPLTVHWQNTGRDKLTSAVVRSQHWFGAGLFPKNISITL